MKKWLDKYNAPEAQNGIEGTMDGLTDKGFNYNGAWGGTMAMGGSLPGATGHFYARYEGGGSMPGDLDFSYPRTKNIPSKGPYAKKTLASAQNGREMQYYQEGLDWNPKMISRDGSSLPQAQGGTFLTQEEQQIIQDRKNRIKASIAAREKGSYTRDNWRQQLADESQAIGDKFRIFPDDPNSIIDEFFNPGVRIGNMASSLGSAALRAKQEDSYLPYITAVGEPLLEGVLEGFGVKSNKQFLKNIVNPFNVPGQKYIKKALGKTAVGKTANKVSNKITNSAKNFKKDFTQGYTAVPTREDGGIIEDPKGQWAHPGKITRIPSNQITMQGVPYPVMGISDTGDTQMMYPDQDYSYDGESVTEYPMMQGGGKVSLRSLMNNDDLKAKSDATKVVPQKTMTTEQAAKLKAKKDAEELQRRKLAIAKSAEAKSKPFSVQNLADESGAIGDKLRIFPNDPDSFIDEYLNPGVMIGDMASGIGRIPLNIQEGDYGQAAMSVATPLTVGALAGIGAQSTGQFANNLFNPFAGTENILKKPISSTPVSDSKMPQSLNELLDTGFKKDPLYHYPTFLKKRQEVGEAISSPEGRKRLQGYIDNNFHIQNQDVSVDKIIKDFKNSQFETTSPRWDPYRQEWRQDAEGNIKMFDVNPENAYAWFRDGFEDPAYISMGQNYTPYDASHILEHEFAHVFQRGNDINTVDNTLANINLKSANQPESFSEFINKINPFNKKEDVGISVTKDIYQSGYDSMKRNADYWNTGAGRGQEKAAFAAEVRENLLQRGLIKDRYENITPEILQKHYNLYKNTKGDKYNLRLYDIMNKDKKNFGYLSEALNRMPALVPTGLATAGIASQLPEQKNGGWLNKYN